MAGKPWLNPSHRSALTSRPDQAQIHMPGGRRRRISTSPRHNLRARWATVRVSGPNTVPGANSGTSTFSTYAAKAGPSIAPLITQGAIMASAVSPAMNVCVPQEPNGASITRRSPRGAHPLSRLRFVFTEVSSIKTTRSGCAVTAGIRRLNQSSRCRLTLDRRRSAASSDFFCAYNRACEGTCRSRSGGRARRSRPAKQTPAQAS